MTRLGAGEQEHDAGIGTNLIPKSPRETTASAPARDAVALGESQGSYVAAVAQSRGSHRIAPSS